MPEPSSAKPLDSPLPAASATIHRQNLRPLHRNLQPPCSTSIRHTTPPPPGAISSSTSPRSPYALQSFEERFVDSPGAFDMGYPAPPPNLDTISSAELAEYESLLAAYIKAIDRLVVRIHFFDRTARAILDGATDRNDLNRRAFPNQQTPALTSTAPIG